jgi:pimeloyl-ACP methyl ester carboxylesterase
VLALFSVSLLLGAIISVVAALRESFETTGALLTAAVPLLLTIATVVASGAALRGVGDAARYLSNSPDNVEEREKIRAELVALLDRLHQQKNPYTDLHSYDRVVVVGHSLGSVIAYDAIRAYWTIVTRDIGLPLGTEVSQAAPVAGRARRMVIERLEEIVGQGPGADLRQWGSRKRKLQALLRCPSDDLATVNGPRWIVSDLVTAGSPLAHAEILLAEGKEDLSALKGRRLFPTDPPPPKQEAGPQCRFEVNSFIPPVGRSSRMLSTAPFAAVVWTNLYFSHDLVGGPLKDVLGKGIEDIPLTESPPLLLNFLFRYPHSSYWPREKKNRSKTLESRDALRGIVLNPVPVLLITGTTEQICIFVERLYSRAVDSDPDSADTVDSDPDSVVVELRILAQNDEDGVLCPAKWVWPGPCPYIDLAAAGEITEAAQSLGLTVCLSTAPPAGSTGNPETAEVNASTDPAMPA